MDNDYELLYLAHEDIDLVVELLYKKYKNIIYYKSIKYCHSNSSIEEYLNEAKITLQEAVVKYRDDIPFIKFLNICLDNNLLNYKKSQKRKKYKILNESISLDETNNNINYESHVDKKNPEENLIEKQNYIELKEKILNKLTWKEELVFNLKEQNYSAKEISEITDNNLRTVYNIIKRIQNKMTKVMSN